MNTMSSRSSSRQLWERRMTVSGSSACRYCDPRQAAGPGRRTCGGPSFFSCGFRNHSAYEFRFGSHDGYRFVCVIPMLTLGVPKISKATRNKCNRPSSISFAVRVTTRIYCKNGKAPMWIPLPHRRFLRPAHRESSAVPGARTRRTPPRGVTVKTALGADGALIFAVQAIRLVEITIRLPHDTAQPDRRLALLVGRGHRCAGFGFQAIRVAVIISKCRSFICCSRRLTHVLFHILRHNFE